MSNPFKANNDYRAAVHTLNAGYFPLGITYQSGSWVYEDGTKATFLNFRKGEPSHGSAGQPWVCMTNDKPPKYGQWNNVGKTDWHKVICEK